MLGTGRGGEGVDKGQEGVGNSHWGCLWEQV